MNGHVRVLVIEDSEDDALLLIRELERGGYSPTWRRIDTAAELERALDEGSWDVILSDYRMPGFTGAEALAMVRGRGLDTPFIVVSGTAGEETAVQMMRDGADDYFLKGSLRLLPGAVARELREAEDRRARREAEERLHLLTRALEASANAVLLADRDGIIQWINPAFTRLTGHEAAEVVGKRQRILQSDRQPESFYEEMENTILRGGVWRGELVSDRRDGTTYAVELTITPVTDEAGEITHFIAVMQDISHRKEMEQKLRESEERYRQLFENAPEAIYIQDRDGTFLDVNAGACEMYGLEKEFFLGRTPADLAAPGMNDLDRIGACVRDTFENGTKHAFEFWGVRGDGSPFPKDVLLVPGTYDGRRVVVAYARDITEAKATETALRESEERYRDLVEKAGVAILVDDEEGRCTYFNRRFVELFGYTEEQLRDMTIEDLVHPDDRELVMSMHRSHLEGKGPRSYRFRGVHRDGRTLHLTADVTPLVRDGKPAGTRSYLRDVTEEQLLQEQLLQAQKMESVGRLAGGVAHDFNNILQAILAHADMGLAGLGSGKNPERHLREVIAAAERARALTRRLLAFSRREEIHPKPVDLNELVAGMLKMLRRLIGEDIEVEFRPGAGMTTVLGDPGQLEQVLMNLVVNARDAMPRGGLLTITTRAVTDPAGGEPHVELAVADTGYGMDEATRQRIFEPFFTTKERDRGTGLGLATVYGVVTRHGGTIRVESEPGKGSTFTVWLPAATEEEPEEEATKQPAPRGGTETILVAEDDPAVRQVVVDALESAGYTVLKAKDGFEAVELFSLHWQDVHMVILDAVMPRKDGIRALEEMRARRPDLPALFSTGYSGPALGQSRSLPEGVPVIQKPYTLGRLLARVREILDGGRDASGSSPG